MPARIDVNVRKKLLITAGLLLACLLAALLIVPILFRGRIEARARAAVNDAVTAQVDWRGISLGFFRHFPNVTLGINGLTVVGRDRFAGDTLASVQSFRLVLDLGSVLGSLMHGSPIVVRSIRVQQPVLRLQALADGSANWDIMKPQPPTAAGPATESKRALNVALRDFELADGSVAYHDAHSGLMASLDGLHETLSGDFARDSLGVRTRTHADHTTVRYAGTPWLDGVALDFQADVDADLANQRFAFRDNTLQLNGLALRFDGTAARSDSAFALDVKFDAPGTAFKEILSLVPAVYAHDYQSLQTSGTFALDGHVHGTLAKDVVPAFALHVRVSDGMFRYPDLPQAAHAIALDLAVANPGGSADSTVVNLRRFHAEIGAHPLDATLTLRTPVSDPYVDANVKGTLDLAELGRTMKLEGVKQLAGVVTADAALAARRSDVANARYDRIAAHGTVSAQGVRVETAQLRQPVAIAEARIALSPRRTSLDAFRAQLGSSDLQATGGIDNLPGFLMHGEPLRATATFASQRFVLDEWKSDQPGLEVIPVPPLLDLTLDGTIAQLSYGALQMANARGSVRVREQRLTLENFTFETLGGRMGVRGFYETVDTTRPNFAVNLNIDSLNIHDASAALLTVRTLAPVARYAQGTFSTQLSLSGALAHDLTPLFDVLDGSGSLRTSRIALEGFPLMQKLSETLKVPRLSNPTLDAIRSSFSIRDGRLFVKPFHVSAGDFGLQVSGSNGIDQSLDYALDLVAPRGVLGDAANQFLQNLATKAGKADLDLQAADSVRLGIHVTGTVTSPLLDVGLGSAVASVGEQAQQAVRSAVEQKTTEAKERVDSTKEAARRQAQARADSLIAEAQVRADTIRAQAKRLGDEVRAEANRRADDVLAAAKSDLARAAAKPVADRIRKEGDDKATKLEKEADDRANGLVAEASKRADALLKPDTSSAPARGGVRSGVDAPAR